MMQNYSTVIICFGFGCHRQQKHHVAAPPPAGVRRRMERKRQKPVGRDKGSLTEQQTEGTGTTTTQIRRKHDKTDRRTDPLSRTGPAPHAPDPRLTQHAVPLPGVRWKLTLSWPNPGHNFRLYSCIAAGVGSKWESQSNAQPWVLLQILRCWGLSSRLWMSTDSVS